MITQIETLKENLRKSEQKVADLVLSRPNMITGMSLADVAAKAGVSEPTVLRFCRAVGCTGFQDLKMRLVGDLARVIPYVHRDVHVEDPAADLAEKIFDRAISTFIRVKDKIDGAAMEEAISLLAEAERIEFYGMGASGHVAMDAQNKFFRLGISCIAYCDHHVQGMSAAILKKGAVVVAISHSGCNIDLLQVVDIALRSGAKVVALTSGTSPLAEKATVTLAAEVSEDTLIQTPMTSRLVHLALMDVLQVGVTLRRGPMAARELEKTKASLRDRYLNRG